MFPPRCFQAECQPNRRRTGCVRGTAAKQQHAAPGSYGAWKANSAGDVFFLLTTPLMGDPKRLSKPLNPPKAGCLS